MLNRVHTESDTGPEDVGCHIRFEIAMETHVIMTPISISSWGNCSVVRSNKHNKLHEATLQFRRVENNIKKNTFLTTC